MIAPQVSEFAKLLAKADEQERKSLLKQATMLAMNQAPEESFEAPIRTLGEYLDTPFKVPPFLIPPLLVRGALCVTVGRAGKGKEQPSSAKVLTPDGWEAIGNLSVGDKISNPVTGYSSTIIGVFPQGTKPVYRLTFSDGAQTEAGLEHLWEVYRRGETARTVVTTKTIIEGLKTSIGRSHFAVPVPEPLQLKQQELPIDPYALGLLLGDGCLHQSSIRFSSADAELVNALNDSVSALNVKAKKEPNQDYSYYVTSTIGPNSLLPAIRGLSLNVKSPDKFIPEIYKLGSMSQRLALLQGLMDTNGHCDGKFSSTSETLIDDVVYLVRSLGGKGRVRSRITTWTHNGEKKTGIAFRAKLALPPEIIPFRLSRKIAKHKPRKYAPRRYVQSVDYVGEKECVCIAVDHWRHLYITDDFVVTHNTVCNLNRLMRWSAGLPWFETLVNKKGDIILAPENPLKVLIIENEGAAAMFHFQLGFMLAHSPGLTDAERKLVRENCLIWGDGGYSGMKFDDPARVKKIRAGCEKWRPDVVFIEPFRGLWSGDENSATDMGVVSDVMIELAHDYDCGVLLAHHERKAGAGEDGEKMSAARGSTVLEGVAATIENFESVRGNDGREISWSKVRYATPAHHAPNPVRLGWDENTWWYTHVPLGQIEQTMLEALRDSPEPLSIKELVDETGEKDHKVREIMKGLVKEGRAVKLPSIFDGSGSTGNRYKPAGDPDSAEGGLGF